MKASMKLFWLIPLIAFLDLINPGVCDEYILYSALVGQAGYNTKVRPVINHTDTVIVNMDMQLLSIVGLDEKNEVLTIVGFFTVEWTDEHLTWNPASQGNLESIVLPPSAVWLPDIGLENSADTFYHETFRQDFHVRLFYTGKIIWSFGGQVAVRCDLEMTYFPFDKQTCKVQFQNWAYHGNEVSLRNASDTITLDSYTANGVWSMDETISTHDDLYLTNSLEPHPQVNFIMRMKRKPNFYVLNLIVPCVMIIVVSLAVFWLPAESGEKISLGVTVLLAFSVFQIVLSDSTPVNSDYTPLLGQLVIGIMSLSTISVLTSTLILYLHHMANPSPWSDRARAIVFKGLAAATCMRGNVPEVTSARVSPDMEKAKEAGVTLTPETDLTQTLSKDDLRVMAADLSLVAQLLKKKDKDDSTIEQWRALARMLDRIFFWISVVYIVAILLCLTRQDPEY